MSHLSSFRHAFRALGHREFRIFWIGQGISVSGTWMQSTAQSWLIYRLTDSALVLGVLNLARFSPALVVAPFAGFLADRFPRKKLLLMTQSTSLVVASVLAWLALTGRIQVGHLLALAFFQGTIDSLDMTVRQTFQMDLVGPADLHSAVSLNSAAFNSARMVGPPIAGILIAWVGEGTCFALNAISYLAVLASLLWIRPAAPTARPAPDPLLEQIASGIRYAWTTPEVRRVLLAVALTSGVAFAPYTLAPALARDVLHAGSQGYGRLLLMIGLGSILGSMSAAALATSRRIALVNALMFSGQAIVMTGLGLARSVPLSMASLALLGSLMAMQLSTCNTSLQTSAPPGLRGRVISLYVWLLQGVAPMGSLAAGWVAQHHGVPAAILGAGTTCALAGLGFGIAAYTRSKALKK